MSNIFGMLFILISINASAKQKITMGALIFPPETVIDKTSGLCGGQSVNVSKTLFEDSEFELEVICTSAARIYKMFNAGTIDFTINIRSTSAIKLSGTFITPNYDSLNLNLYQRNNSEYKNIASVIRGFDYHGYKQALAGKGYKFVDVPNGFDAVKMFHLGRTDTLLSYQITYDYYFQREGVDEFLDEVTVNHLTELPNFYVVSRSSINHDRLITFFEQFLNNNNITSFKASLMKLADNEVD